MHKKVTNKIKILLVYYENKLWYNICIRKYVSFGGIYLDKNDVLELEIIDNGMNFEGIAKHEDKVIFIPEAISGEKVKAKILKNNKKFAFAKLEKVIIPSTFREEPFCSVFHRCGGCSAQHIDYGMQLVMKNNMVRSVLRKENVEFQKLNTTVGMGLPFYYRNKVQYPIRLDKNGNTVMGFYSKRSHQVIENNCCYIQERVIDMLAKQIFEKIIEFKIKGYDEEKNEGDVRHLLLRRGYHTGEIMVIFVVNREEIVKEYKFNQLLESVKKLNENIKGVFVNINSSSTNEILGDKTIKISGEDYITDFIGTYRYFISPKSFFQVNTLQAEVLYNTLKENLELNGNEVIFDLYSGVGSIGIFLSDKVSKIYGIEIEKTAVEMANLNLKINDVKNAEYIAGSVEDKIEEFEKRNIAPDVIVVDPPRKGLDDKSIEYILNFSPKKIGYVSCNPATMARDIKKLSEKYDIKKITPVDMFPHTSHVECVTVLYAKETP